jgi:TonB-dependent starch-binding outer membrane protein SusC
MTNKSRHIPVLVALLLCGASAGAAQQPMVTGQVTNAENMAPIAGAHVGVAGTNIGVLTDAVGRYTVPARGDATLVVSMIGFASERVEVQGRSQVDVALRMSALALDEIRVVGYTVQTQRSITGSVASVSAADLDVRLVATLQDALRGRVAGVTVRNSGQPGTVANVTIRGQAFTADNQPLYVVDGMYLDNLRNLNPNDIESIQVLKDASAASQYGARAANGVVIVTTRQGRAADANRVNLRSTYGYSQVPRLIPMRNAREWAEMTKAMYENARERLGPTAPPPPQGVLDVLEGRNTFDTDWQREVTRPGHLHDHVLSTSGGSANGDARYFISGGYTNQKGTLLDTDFERYTLRANSELRRGRLTLGENVQLGRSHRTEPTSPEQGQLGEALRMLPSIPVFNTPDLKYGQDRWGHGTADYPTFASNPVGGSLLDNNTYQQNEAIGTLFANVDLFAGFQYRTNLGFRYSDTSRDQFGKVGTVRLNTDRGPATLIIEESNSNSLMLENLLSFNRVVGPHNIIAVAGATQQRWTSNFVSASRRGFADENLRILSAGTQNIVNNQSRGETRLNSYLGRVSYSFGDRYMAEGSFRRDGSSRFGPENRWGNFYAGSVGWVMSEEGFFQSIPLLGRADFFKARASYGTLGNQDFADYEWMANVTSTSQAYILGPGQGAWSPGLMPISLGNPAIRWQDNSMTNIGVDLGLFNNRVSITAEYYLSESDGVLARVPLVPSVGSAQSPFVNVGAIRNSGFELGLQHTYTRGALELGSGLNFNTVSNKVLRLGGLDEAIISGSSRTAVGEPMGHFWLIQTCGIFQNQAQVDAHGSQPTARPGDQCFVDHNGDGQIDTGDRKYMGSPWPKFEGGAFMDGRYRQLDFTVGLRGSYGAKIFNAIRPPLEEMTEDNNTPRWLNPWTPNNPNANAPMALFGAAGTANARGPNDRYLEDGSYLKIQNFQVGYALPASLLDRVGIQAQTARVYLNVQDIHTFTNYLGWDPEFRGGTLTPGVDTGNSRYPNPRTFIFGVDVGF